jgi:hypothetical protein
MTYRLISTGIELDDKTFEEARKWCFKYRLGEISSSRFEGEYRKLGFTRAVAYRVCYDIWTGNYEYILKKWVNVMISISIVTTSTKGTWAERYFEIREFTQVLKSMVDTLTFDIMNITVSCTDIEDLGDLFVRLAGNYMESKGYDLPMIEEADVKYAGISIIDEFEDDVDRKCDITMEIWDAGSSKSGPKTIDGKLVGMDMMGMRRFVNKFDLGVEYWKDLEETCRYVVKQMRRFGFTKYKEVRW